MLHVTCNTLCGTFLPVKLYVLRVTYYMLPDYIACYVFMVMRYALCVMRYALCGGGGGVVVVVLVVVVMLN